MVMKKLALSLVVSCSTVSFSYIYSGGPEDLAVTFYSKFYNELLQPSPDASKLIKTVLEYKDLPQAPYILCFISEAAKINFWLNESPHGKYIFDDETNETIIKALDDGVKELMPLFTPPYMNFLETLGYSSGEEDLLETIFI